METTGSIPEIGVVHKNGVCRIEIRRPEKKNALTRNMYAAMSEAMEAADKDAATRVVFLHAKGDCFCAGNDLKEFQQAGEDPKLRAGRENPFLKAISRLEKPMVAAVNGQAIGVGTTLLLHFDLVYAGCSATFSMPFVRLGLCPEAGSSFLLPRLVGHQRASEILLLSRSLSAREAVDLGMVNALFADDRVVERSLAIAEKLAQQPPESVRLTKALLKKSARSTLFETMDDELDHFSRRLASGECREALAAFFQHRPPDFSSFT